MASSGGSQIPVVDFSAMSLENEDPLNENKQAVKVVADQLYRAFSTIGFAYLQNHGISEQMVSLRFFRFFYLATSRRGGHWGLRYCGFELFFMWYFSN